MKENKYDDDKFFEAYSRFPRSVSGLSAAGEWHALKALLPPFEGKRVLDIGCGFGWHCAYAARHGASYVLGIDISQRMLTAAREKNTAPAVEYRSMAMEDIDFPSASFDIVISSLAFHYTPDFSDICRRVHACLIPEGDFVFSVEHPVFTAQGTQDWVYAADGSPDHWPVDRYFSEGKRDAVFLGEHVTKYHRTLMTYLGELLKTGFFISGFVEPTPGEHLLDTVPGMRDELRRPMMLLVSAKRQ